MRHKSIGFLLRLIIILSLAASAGCWKTKEPLPEDMPALEPVEESDWPVLFDDLDPVSLRQAAEQSLAYLDRVPKKVFSFGVRKVSAREMFLGIQRFLQLQSQYTEVIDFTEALKKEFVLYRSIGSDGEGKVLYTGYYEPVLQALKTPQEPFVYPLYALPEDLVTVNLKQFSDDLPQKRLIGQVLKHRLVPYPDREAIDFDHAIKDQAEALAYLSDPVEAFFLHIQGSGQVVFSDGSRLRLGYAGTNGHPYRSIGRYLIDKGLMEYEKMSMQGIKAFLSEHPEKRRGVLSHNPSYVFFRPLSAEGGPLGCFETPLVAGRSIATDRRIFPGLALAYVSGLRPGEETDQVTINRFVFNQDTGGAIRGPGRLDLFYGSGPEAGSLAGRTKHPGYLYFLAPKPGLFN